jgi:predicted DNA-binding transcriptional regulator YafY
MPVACARALPQHQSEWPSAAFENRGTREDFERQPDGALELSFEGAGLIEITPGILTWGDTVEVLQPPELRERQREVSQRMTQRYE